MMHSKTSIHKMRPFRASVLFGAVASLALTSCAEFREPVAMSRSVPYFALYTTGVPATHLRRAGFFAEENGCVVFKPADYAPAMTPVFPEGQTQLVTDGVSTLGMYLKGSPLGLGTLYRIAGGEAPGNTGKLVLTDPVPANCPTTYFIVEGAVKAAGADVDAALFCLRTQLCRSYKLD
jgi:hypothetical protein